MKKNHIIVLTLILSAALIFTVLYFVMNRSKIVEKEGIIVLTFEDLYFVEGEDSWPINNGNKTYWIPTIDNEKAVLEKLNWVEVDGSIPVQYSKVSIIGYAEGPGAYGRAGRNYTYQLKVKEIIPLE